MKLLHENIEEVKKACVSYSVKELYAFGSSATDQFDDNKSDVDLLVVFAREDPEGAFDQFFGLKEELERITGRPVDLVSYRAIRNPFFKEEVDQTKQRLYVA